MSLTNSRAWALFQTQGGKQVTVYFWDKPQTAYYYLNCRGQLEPVWLDAAQAREMERWPTAYPDFPPNPNTGFPTVVTTLGPGRPGDDPHTHTIPMRDFTCAVVDVGNFKDQDHVRWFYQTHMHDPIAFEITDFPAPRVTRFGATLRTRT